MNIYWDVLALAFCRFVAPVRGKSYSPVKFLMLPHSNAHRAIGAFLSISTMLFFTL